MLEGCANAKVKGAFLPLGDFRRDPTFGNVLFVGDAAGLVDPMTGEGIAYALESGALAAQAVAKALAAGEVAGAGAAYRHALTDIHDDLTQALRLRRYAYARFFSKVFARNWKNPNGAGRPFSICSRAREAIAISRPRSLPGCNRPGSLASSARQC